MALIPNRPPGYTLGDLNAPVRIEAFLDIQCPFSKKTWPTLMALRDAYAPDQIVITVQMMVLANHRQAWDMTRLLHAVADGDADRFRDFATFLFDRQERFHNGPFADRTHNDLLEFAAEITAEWSAAAGRPEPDIAARMQRDETAAAARTPIRHAARRGVWSTPTYLINGVEARDIGSATAKDEWRATIDELLSAG